MGATALTRQKEEKVGGTERIENKTGETFLVSSLRTRGVAPGRRSGDEGARRGRGDRWRRATGPKGVREKEWAGVASPRHPQGCTDRGKVGVGRAGDATTG